MQSSTSRSFQHNTSRARSSSSPLSSVQLPLDTSPKDFSEAVRKLKQRPTDELQRARKHHRRALKALRDDAYEALGDQTRTRLIERLQTNLTALNKALETVEPEEALSSQSTNSASSLFQKALTWLW